MSKNYTLPLMLILMVFLFSPFQSFSTSDYGDKTTFSNHDLTIVSDNVMHSTTTIWDFLNPNYPDNRIRGVNTNLLKLQTSKFTKTDTIVRKIDRSREVWAGYEGWEGNPDSLDVYIDTTWSDAEKDSCRAAMARWNAAGSVPKFRETTTAAGADITITQGNPGAGNAGLWQGEPATGKLTSSTITIADNPSPGLVETVTHELGHAIGLNDTDAAANAGDVMKGSGPSNGTNGNLSQHDSTEMRLAAASITEIAADPPEHKNASFPEQAILPGEFTDLNFILPDFYPPETAISVLPIEDPLLFVEYVFLEGDQLYVGMFSDPMHGSGTIYFDITLFPPAGEPYHFWGIHYLNTNPVPPTDFSCPFEVTQSDGLVHVAWEGFHNYPHPNPLRSRLTVNGNTLYEVKPVGDYSIALEPGTHTLELVVDDHQGNSANFAMDVVVEPIQECPTVDAGSNATINEGETHILADATAINYQSLFWLSEGDGIFDDPSVLNAIYTPGAGDADLGEVTLCLYALPIPPCPNPAIDCMTLTIDSFTPTIPPWEEPFEVYALGSDIVGQGGWEFWFGGESSPGARVTNEQVHTGEQALEIMGAEDPTFADDIVHQFTGCTSGKWELSAWQFIPELASGGSSYFVVLDQYGYTLEECHWTAQIKFDTELDIVVDEGDGSTLPLVKGEWAEIKIVIDLDDDEQTTTYNGQLLSTKSWTLGIPQTEPGILNIAAIDLWSNDLANAPVYYDDMALTYLANWGLEDVDAYQISYEWGEHSEENSTVGLLSCTYIPTDQAMYLNAFSIDTAGQIYWLGQNYLPDASYSSVVQKTTFTYDLAPLGVESGTSLDSMPLWIEADTSPLTFIPDLPPLEVWPEMEISILVDDTYNGFVFESTLPGYFIDWPVPVDPLWWNGIFEEYVYRGCNIPEFDLDYTNHPAVPGGYAGDQNACAPAAVSSSLEWLEDVYKDSTPNCNNNQTHRQVLEDLSGEMNRPANKPPPTWPDYIGGKLKYTQKHKLPIRTKFQLNTGSLPAGTDIRPVGSSYSADNQTGPTGKPDWDWLVKEMNDGEDVEINVNFWDGTKWNGGHVVVCTGIIELNNGSRGIWFKHDRVQKETDANNVLQEPSIVTEGNGWLIIPELSGPAGTAIVTNFISESYDKTVDYKKISGTLKDSEGNAVDSTKVKILARRWDNPDDSLTTTSGGIKYKIINGVGFFDIDWDDFENPLKPGDRIHITFFDGESWVTRVVIINENGDPVWLDVTVEEEMVVHLDFTQWQQITIPPHKTLKVHWDSVTGCGNTDIVQWNGSDWYVPEYGFWNHNPTCTTKEITNDTDTAHFKRFHCDDRNGFYLDFTIVESTGITTPGNQIEYAVVNTGGMDYTNAEFGEIEVIDYVYKYEVGSQLGDFPATMGGSGVHNLEVEFESYDNEYWSEMELHIDLLDVEEGGFLTVEIPDQKSAKHSIFIAPGQTVVNLNMGAIPFPGFHTMLLSVDATLSFGIDCYNFSSLIELPSCELPAGWEFVTTGQVHLISIPLSANPNIFGTPLGQDDWIGVFYLDDDGKETCGGAVQWDGVSNVGLSAYGNDPITPEKDGFDAGERFRWRMYDCSTLTEYPAGATYDETKPNQGYFADFGLSSLTSLEVMVCQYYSFATGWNSISSYITPFTPDVEVLFTPIVDCMIILRNLTEFYWPDEELNTIGDWDNGSGYALKMSCDADFEICGADFATNEVMLETGWYYLPALSQCSANAMDLFGDNLDDIVIVQDLIGTGVFWPAQGVYSLETIDPGKAYKIKAANPFTVTFPGCDGKATTPAFSQVNSINTRWGEMNMTPSTAVVAFRESAIADFIKGDVIGVFGQNNLLFGYMEITGNAAAQAITLFGDDAYTDGCDGFVSNEMISFRLYRSSTKEIFDLEVEYDASLDNSGRFHINGLSAISGVTLTGLDTPSGWVGSGINIFPNPSPGIFNIEGIDGEVEISIFNAFGDEILNVKTNLPDKVDLSGQSKGIYIIRISTKEGIGFEKLVIN